MRISLLPLIGLLALALPASRATEPEARSWPLDAATTLVLVEDHRAPLVEVVLEFPAGNWSPWVQHNHAVEAFEIQAYDSGGSLRSRADALAADLTVTAGTHASMVRAACLRDDLEELLKLVQDLLTGEDFDKSELKRWKQGRKIEWNSAQKIPQFRLAQTRARLFFAESDPRRRPYEKPPSLVTAPARLAEVRDSVVRLPRRVIAFAGAVTADDARRLASGLLPPADAEPPEGLEPVLQPMTASAENPDARTTTMKRINQTFFHYGRASLTNDDPRYPAFLIADHVLGGHFHSRMSSALRHEGGETYAAYTVGKGDVNQQAYGLGTFTRAENTEATANKLHDVLALFHDQGITDQEREAAVGFLLGRRRFSRQSPAQILERFLRERRNGLAPGFYDDLVDLAAATTLDEINALVGDFFNPSSFILVEVRPE